MNHHDHYEDHLKTVLADFERALERSAKAGAGYGGVVLHSGAEVLVHRDDQPHLFRQDFNFARLAPLPGPDHLAVVRPGERPKLIRVVPQDYWYEEPAKPAIDVQRGFDYVEVSDVGGFRVLRLVEQGNPEGYRYLVGVRVDGRKLDLVEIYYPTAEQEQRYSSAIEAVLVWGAP